MSTLAVNEDPNDEDSREHANYTPQTDVMDEVNEYYFVMESSGVIDADGSSVHSKEQLSSAVQSLQGTLFIPHGAQPVNDYKNPALWIRAHLWLSIWPWWS